jgi:hypothetical protein
MDLAFLQENSISYGAMTPATGAYQVLTRKFQLIYIYIFNF